MDHVVDTWNRIAGMLQRGMSLDDIEAALERERRKEMAELEREHRRRMWHDVMLPFVVGMASLALVVAAVHFRYGELAFLALPGVGYSSWKLAPFLYGQNI